MPTDVENIQQEESSLMIIKKEFKDLLGHYNDPASLYSRLISMCQRSIRPHERADVEERLQEILVNVFERYARKGGIASLDGYCITSVRKMLNEFKREKSRSIDYKKFARNIREILELSEGFVDFSSEARKFLSQIEEQSGDSIDEGLVLDHLIALIKIGKTYQGLDIKIIEVMKQWASKIREKKEENSRQSVSIDSWTNDEDGDKFNPFSNIPDSASNVDEILVERQISNQLSDCIGKLPLHYREFINLYFFADMGLKEIAEQLGKAISTLSERNKRAILLLRECMTKAHEMRGQA